MESHVVNVKTVRIIRDKYTRQGKGFGFVTFDVCLSLVSYLRKHRDWIIHKYKVYIIDEVHMLSAGAFNALLKTLEEPPSHAIFILATTEVYKIPITILSRCQRYDFKKISQADMVDYLKEICHNEKITFKDGVLEEIYELSEGCLRDALSILDQLSKSNKNLSVENILDRYDLVSEETIEELLQYAKESKIGDIVATIKKFQDSGMNPQKLIKKMIKHLEKTCVDIKLNKIIICTTCTNILLILIFLKYFLC